MSGRSTRCSGKCASSSGHSGATRRRASPTRDQHQRRAAAARFIYMLLRTFFYGHGRCRPQSAAPLRRSARSRATASASTRPSTSACVCSADSVMRSARGHRARSAGGSRRPSSRAIPAPTPCRSRVRRRRNSSGWIGVSDGSSSSPRRTRAADVRDQRAELVATPVLATRDLDRGQRRRRLRRASAPWCRGRGRAVSDRCPINASAPSTAAPEPPSALPTSPVGSGTSSMPSRAAPPCRGLRSVHAYPCASSTYSTRLLQARGERQFRQWCDVRRPC